MAAGGWLAGILYDHFGFYTAAFVTGIAFNLLNLAVVGSLVFRQHRDNEPSRERADLPRSEGALAS
jgi:predicted MFS family arabinose efflux permease